jgi:dephospho-CoA kinase
VKDMINYIVEMDKKARKETEELKKQALIEKNEINSLKSKIREKYFEKAREKLKKNELTDQKKAEKEQKTLISDQKTKLSELEQIFSENSEVWVKNIYDRVLECE